MRTRLLPVRLSSQVCVIAYDSHALLSGELMRGFERGWPWLTVALSALGGIAVSMALKYADNILKTFAVGCSIVLNCAISSLFLGVPLSLAVIAGVLLVVGSTFVFQSVKTRGDRDEEHSAHEMVSLASSESPPRRSGTPKTREGGDGESPPPSAERTNGGGRQAPSDG